MITSDILSISEFSYEQLENAEIMHYARTHLPNHGALRKDEAHHYHYLKIHDDFIFKLFPYLKDMHLKMPDYFPPKNFAGAHITIIYPDEIKSDNRTSILNMNEINTSYIFEVNEIILLKAFNKTFIALVVSAPELQALRRQYGLPDKLNYRGLRVPFHITIAISK